jgi:hypothetical protein
LDNNGNEGKGYDIESINPGDTCSFYGFDADVNDLLRDNMIITKVNYTLDKVELEVQIVKSGMLDTQSKQTIKIGEITSGGLKVPESYT